MIIKDFKHFKGQHCETTATGRLMERAGTGGSLFRNLYREFLKDCAELLNSNEIKDAYLEYS